MLALALAGCASWVFEFRQVACDTPVDVSGEALVVEVVDGPGCFIRVAASAKKSRSNGVVRFDDAELVQVQGVPSELTLQWSSSVELTSEELNYTSTEPGTLTLRPQQLLLRTHRGDAQVTGPLDILLEQAQVRVCTNVDGAVQADVGSSFEWVGTANALVWDINGDGTSSRLVDTGSVIDCCEQLSAACELPPEADVDADADADTDTDTDADVDVDSTCESCHDSLEPAHPGVAVTCVGCHGGNPQGSTAALAHIAMPGDLSALNDLAAYRRHTLTGITDLTWLQFRNPGDLRVVSEGLSCGSGGCHEDQTERVLASMMGTAAGIYSSTRYTMGLPNRNGVALYSDTAADVSHTDLLASGGFTFGQVTFLSGLEEFGGFPQSGPNAFFNNNNLTAAGLDDGLSPLNQVAVGSDLERVLGDTVAATCSGCHLGTAGPNNRTGSYRSSGCTACHMPTALDGRSQSDDDHVNGFEPITPDALEAGERSHVRRHTLTTAVPDGSCATCHVGTNATSLQYQGIRLDRNQDVTNGAQYPETPPTYSSAQFHPLFQADNNTYAGYTFNQLLVEEDYDGDGRDDTPADVHYEAGLGCIDCHGSNDLHGTSNAPYSRQNQVVGVTCETCHGTLDAGPSTGSCVTASGQPDTCVLDRFGVPLTNVTQAGDGTVQLVSRVTGALHDVVQLHDLVNPDSIVYSEKASFAMGRVDNNPNDGTGPVQTLMTVTPGFSHTDNVACSACHAAWTNSCIGCHINTAYDANPNNLHVSALSGQRSVLDVSTQQVYASPVLKYLIVNPAGEIDQGQPGSKVFWQFTDSNVNPSTRFAFTDRNGLGNFPNVNTNTLPGLSHNHVAQHSTRGRPTDTNEGVNNCAVCHLNQEMLATYGAAYAAYRLDYLQNGELPDLEGQRTAIGLNPQNQLNHPNFVAMTVGLGTGLFQFDADGCPVNSLDGTPRAGCPDAASVIGEDAHYDLDRIVELTGRENVSSNTPLEGGVSPLRTGALKPELSGPLGSALINNLSDPVNGWVLDTWIDADGGWHYPVDPPTPVP